MRKFVVIVCAVACSTVSALADSQVIDGHTWQYSVTNGQAIATNVAPAVGDLSIPPKLGGFPVTGIHHFTFWHREGLTSVKVPASVTNISYAAFSFCNGLKSFAVAADNPVYRSIDGLLCSKDGKVLHQGVAGNVTIPSGVTNVAMSAFLGRKGLTSVTIPPCVSCIDRDAFFGCDGLSSVAIPQGVTCIGNMAFYGCAGLTTVTIPASVTNIIRGAFGDCHSMRYFVVDAANPNYRAIKGMLCSKDGKQLITGVAGNLTIPSCVTSMGSESVFGCTGRVFSVTIPSGVTNIEGFAFINCDGITSVKIPSSVIRIEDEAFCGCWGVKSFTVDKKNPRYRSINGLLCTKDGSKLVSGVNGDVTIPESVTEIRPWSFYGSKGLTSVKIPAGVVKIGDYAFDGCSGLKSFSVDAANKKYCSLNGMLCSKDGTTIFKMVKGRIVIPSSVTNIVYGAFPDGKDIVSFSVAADNPTYRSIDGLLCSKDGKVLIRGCAGKVRIPPSVTSISSYAFFGFTNALSFLTMPRGVEDIGQSCFAGCVKLATVTIPKSVQRIGIWAFSECPIKTVFVDKGDVDRVRGLYGWRSEVKFVERSRAGAAVGVLPNLTFTPEAVKEYKAEADAGDADALYLLGFMYQMGKGVETNLTEAVRLYRMSAEQGNSRGQCALGLMYSFGAGVKTNQAEAIKWILKAAKQNEVHAQVRLGYVYENGIGVETNLEESVKWYRKAAEQGDALAQHTMGEIYEWGRGVKMDVTEAVKWYRRAAAQGFGPSQDELGWEREHAICGETDELQDNLERVGKYVRELAAGEFLGKGLRFALGVDFVERVAADKDMVEAAMWLRRSAVRGNVDAQCFWGWCCAKGNGVSQDLPEAMKWIRRAADRGNFRAQLSLGWCYANGFGVAKSAAESEKWYRKAIAQDVGKVILHLVLLGMYPRMSFLCVMFALSVLLIMLFLSGHQKAHDLFDLETGKSPVLRLVRRCMIVGLPFYLLFLIGGGVACLLFLWRWGMGTLDKLAASKLGIIGFGVVGVPELKSIMFCWGAIMAIGVAVLIVAEGMSIRRLVKWLRAKKSFERPNLTFAQYAKVKVMENSILWGLGALTGICFALMGYDIQAVQILLGTAVVILCTLPTRKKFDKILNGKPKKVALMKFIVIYREPGEPKPKQTVLKSDGESSLRRECEDKGWRLLLIRGCSASLHRSG